ncbi:MAG: thioredoxin-disulfide reductase [Myxococcales bacterium]|nr:thioredoxin-disulfide reductase [Myxococcales bacterium]
MSEKIRNVIIIGSGPAGLTACIYAARANLSPLCIEGFSAGGLIPGGQLMFTTEVENYPGFVEPITGPELMARFRGQAERQGTELVTADVDKVDLSARPFKVWADGQLYLAKTIIVSTGARANYIGLENEEKLKNRGVSACAVCDGPLFKGRNVVVVGGGDTAMEEATYLAGLCPSVTLVHRRDEFRASKVMVDRARNNPRITMKLSHAVVDVLDASLGKVTTVMLKDLKSGEVYAQACEGLFVAIGHTPLTELFRGQLDVHENGYLKVKPGTTSTNVPGVFAAGDVSDWVYRQAVTAAGTGCMAALEAERWLAANDPH